MPASADLPALQESEVELASLRSRLEAAEETLRAIRLGEADAVVVDGPDGPRVFTLLTADHSYRMLVEQMAEGALISDRSGLVLYCNRRFCDVLQLPRQRLVGRSLLEICAYSDQDTLRTLLEEAGATPASATVHFNRFNGERVPFHLTLTRFDDPGFRGICGIATDLSTRIKQERESASEKVTSGILEFASSAILMCDPDGGIVRANRRAFELLGGDIVGRSFDQVLATPLSFAALIELSTRRDVGPLAVSLDSVTRFVLVRVRELGGGDGSEQARLVVTLTDVSEMKLAEDALRQHRQRLSRILNTVADAIVIVDANGRITFANSSAEQMFDLPLERLLEQTLDAAPWRALNDDAPLAAHEAPCARLWEEGAGIVEYRLELDTMKLVSIHAVPLRAKSEPPAMVLSIRDITRERTLERELLQVQKLEAVGRLAGGVAHDFNNLLTVIGGLLDILIADADLVRWRDDLAELKRNSDRAAALTRQLLAFSRRQVLRPRVIDLAATIREFARMLERLIGEDIDLVITQPDELGAIEADPGQIEQVLMNLAVNAKDAMPGGGRLSIETRNLTLDESKRVDDVTMLAGEYVEIVVSDTGTGMDRHVYEHLFEPFFTTKEPGRGTGLGLATVYGIVRQSNGYIAVYSEPGMGSTFRIVIPRVYAEPQPASPPSPPASLAGSETLLLVEDEPAVRRLASRYLVREGYAVHEAATPEEALQLIREHGSSLRLVISDVVMPQMTGRQLMEIIMQQWPDLRCVFMSGYTQDEVLRRGIIAEGDLFVEKPFTREALLSTVRRALTNDGNA